MAKMRSVLRGGALVLVGVMLGLSIPASAGGGATYRWAATLGLLEDPSGVTIVAHNPTGSIITVSYKMINSGGTTLIGSQFDVPAGEHDGIQFTCSTGNSVGCTSNYVSVEISASSARLMPQVRYTPSGGTVQNAFPGDFDLIAPKGSEIQMLTRLRSDVDVLKGRTSRILRKVNRVLDRL